jgi:hypothetical protein
VNAIVLVNDILLVTGACQIGFVVLRSISGSFVSVISALLLRREGA